jgi:hypothetical protein
LHRDVGTGGGRHAQDDAVGRQRLQLGLLQQMRMRDGKDAIKRRQRGKHVRRFQQRQGGLEGVAGVLRKFKSQCHPLVMSVGYCL